MLYTWYAGMEGGHALDGCGLEIVLEFRVDTMGFIIGHGDGTHRRGGEELLDDAEPFEGDDGNLCGSSNRSWVSMKI